MQCPHCGYMMSPLDKECERCRQRGFVPPAPQNPADVPPGSPAAFVPPQAAPLPDISVATVSVPSGPLPPPPFVPGGEGCGAGPVSVQPAYQPPANPYDPASAVFLPAPPAFPARPAPASALKHVPLLIVTLVGMTLIVMALRFRMREAEGIQERTAQSIAEDMAALRIEREAARPTIIIRPPHIVITPPSSEAVTQQLQQTREQARQAQEQARQAEEQAQQLQLQIEELRRQQSQASGVYDREQREIQIQRLLQIQAQERQNADQRLQQMQREHQQQMMLLQQQQARERLDNQRRLQELEQQNQTQRDQTPPPSAAPNGNP